MLNEKEETNLPEENQVELSFAEKHAIYLPPGYGVTKWQPNPQNLGEYFCSITLPFNYKMVSKTIVARVNMSEKQIDQIVIQTAAELLYQALSTG
jgi:hypothetical protein